MNNSSIAHDTVADRETLFINLYKKAFPVVAKYVSKMGGSLDEAKDIFQDAVIIYYEKVITNQFAISVSEKAYILGIAKNLWLKTYQTNNRQLPIDIVNDAIVQEETHLSTKKLFHHLETAGHKCLQLLRAFYYDKLSIASITTQFGYSGSHSATVQKYKCLEKVRDHVKQTSLTYEDFLE